MSAFERCPLTGAVHWRRFNYNTNILKIKLYTGNDSTDNKLGYVTTYSFSKKIIFYFLIVSKIIIPLMAHSIVRSQTMQDISISSSIC